MIVFFFFIWKKNKKQQLLGTRTIAQYLPSSSRSCSNKRKFILRMYFLLTVKETFNYVIWLIDWLFFFVNCDVFGQAKNVQFVIFKHLFYFVQQEEVAILGQFPSSNITLHCSLISCFKAIVLTVRVIMIILSNKNMIFIILICQSL